MTYSRVDCGPSKAEIRAHQKKRGQMSKPRVIVAMAHTSDYTPLAMLTVPTVQSWCEKHNYSFYYHPQWEQVHTDDGDRMKVRIYKNLYEMNRSENAWDVFLWVDSDAIVTNSNVDIDELLDFLCVEEKQHFLWGYDPGGPNSGVYLARFTPEAHAFMHTQFSRSIEMGWGDNTAMNQVSLLPPHKDIIKCVPGGFLNAYVYDLYGWGEYKYIGDWQSYRDVGKDFILHFPGIETWPHLQDDIDLEALTPDKYTTFICECGEPAFVTCSCAKYLCRAHAFDHKSRPNRLELVQEYLPLCK